MKHEDWSKWSNWQSDKERREKELKNIEKHGFPIESEWNGRKREAK